MKYRIILLFSLIFIGCYRSNPSQEVPLVSIQIQDRNGLTETISTPDRLENYKDVDYLSSQPYKKVLRVFKQEGKTSGKINTYHPNGYPWQYLEVQDMRASGVFREWHPNGALKIEATVIGGPAELNPSAQKDWLFDGISRIWDDQGRLIAEIPYEKGMLEGVSIYYFPNGNIQKESPYHQNNLHGVEKEYLLSHQVNSETHYLAGIRNGESKGYWTANQASWIEYYEDGSLLSGLYFDQSGTLLSEVKNGNGFQTLFQNSDIKFLIEFRGGRPEGVVKEFTPKKELKSMFRVKNNQKQGEEIIYFLTEEIDEPTLGLQPKLSIPWDKNSINGVVKTWYNNGKLQSQREYAKNKKNGSSVGWYKDGTLMQMEEYEEDRLLKGQYYKKNQKNCMSTISNGNGIATLYDEHGVFLRKVQYIKGKPVDPEN